MNIVGTDERRFMNSEECFAGSVHTQLNLNFVRIISCHALLYWVDQRKQVKAVYETLQK